MSLQSVSKTIQVLESFLKFDEGQSSVSELARELGWSRSSTHQYASTLAKAGWLVQNEKRDYQLSPRAAVFGRFASENSGVSPEVTGAMMSLVEVLNEPISYAMLNGNEAIIIERHAPKRSFAITTAVEPHMNLLTSASGMVLLAFDAHSSEGRRAGKEEELQVIRAQGYAETHSEWLGDLVDAIAVPIMSNGECLGALSVIAPAGRMDLPNARAALAAARAEVEQQLSGQVRESP